ncbi:hypothetical protein NGR_b06100 (plasmid) [Sinorhizobium fredii NGR234]|uniref:DUF2946 domain-containing protein n=1 Tax=Sinorhizobium fredii (strain NBRC 101917 / NGR234) TaxID=394 RepID=Q6W135_SINFN|nr:DUF2946 family protein [Sinorhizobium fredii]AAQ87533.1 Hypothetical protein RNGR00408 [Sinorhizobium fredii NGR234]ACP22068.1 hypothetical protein NGR_b06100 [Sinorhizobium fredii NGR234]
MITMRGIVGDRITATAIALLFAYLLLLQGLLSGTSQGAMAAAAVDPLHEICFSSGSIGQARDDGTPAKKSSNCPCGTLCRLASTDMPAILGGENPVALAAVDIPVGVVPSPEEVASTTLRRLIAEPRAPPFFS